MKVSVVGGGYVGLVTAACFAEIGHDVCCVENNPGRLAKLQAGKSPIYEPGLDKLLTRHLDKRLRFTDQMHEAVDHADTIFLCVGTPQREDGSADLSQVESAARQIAHAMNGYRLIVEKSTVPVNTHRWIERTISREIGSNVSFDVASNPEFLREGSAVDDFMTPDRVVIGVESEEAAKRLDELYKPLTDRGYRLITTDVTSAELIKHASNSFLATKISYINMVSQLCERVGADVKTVSMGMGLDPRIGQRFLDAGIGYGGSCFPKDVRAFIRMAEDAGLSFGLLQETERINKSQQQLFLEKVREVLWISRDKTIGVWGLTFKPLTDDVRESPATSIVGELLADGAKVKAYDPQGRENFAAQVGDHNLLRFVDSMVEAVVDADALLLITDWSEFGDADWREVRALMRYPIVLDGRNLLDPDAMKAAGFEYYGVGRGRHL